jgi:hypothetical protein
MRKFILVATTIIVVVMFLFQGTDFGNTVNDTFGNWLSTITVGGVGYGIGIFLSIDNYIKNKFGTSLTDSLIDRLKTNTNEAKAILTNIFGETVANVIIENGEDYFKNIANDHEAIIMQQKEKAILLQQRIKDGLFTGDELTNAQSLLNDILQWLAQNDTPSS